MNNRKIKGYYKVGLNLEKEAVISAHFMHSINLNNNLQLFDEEKFIKSTCSINCKLIFDKLLPILLEASEKFIAERIQAAKLRARTNYQLYNLNSPDDITSSEIITEIMLDRQFLKGSRLNYSHALLYMQIKDRINQNKPIKMVIPALPYKSSSPLKTRGILPDFAEINFLLGLSEIAKAIDYVYRENKPKLAESFSIFTVICDGSRFNQFTNEPLEAIEEYQNYLKKWIKELGIENFIEILDYQMVIFNSLPTALKKQKKLIRENTIKNYNHIFIPLLDPNNMQDSLTNAIKSDPDPEESNIERRFVPLFKSLIYIIRYKILNEYVKIHNKNYKSLYHELTKNIFSSYVILNKKEFENITTFLSGENRKFKPKEEQILEYLRCAMLREAWEATIAYIAEIKSDRELEKEPILICMPDHIRWTIHAKSGQLAVLTTTASGDPVQAWHGVGVFKNSQKGKIKLYALPVLSLEGNDAIPIIVTDDNKKKTDNFLSKYIQYNQPLFYIYPNIVFKDINELIDKIHMYITRKRKF